MDSGLSHFETNSGGTWATTGRVEREIVTAGIERAAGTRIETNPSQARSCRR